MAKFQTAQQKKRAKKPGFVPDIELPQAINYIILSVGVGVIILGYIIMAIGDATSPLAVTVAPMILVIGYCVIIPAGIIYRKKRPDSQKAA